jgi:adenosine deaminase
MPIHDAPSQQVEPIKKQSLSEIQLLIQRLPKAELHLHIEGTLEPELMFQLAQKNKVTLPYSTIESIKKAYHFNQLQDFLTIYYAGMQVLITESDFYELTKAYLQRCQQQNIRHVELFFDPQGHTERGIAFSTVIKGIVRALNESHSKWGITYKVILCFLRHLSEESAIATLNEAKPYLAMIDGVGLDSSEIGHPPSKFKRVFLKAHQLGLKRVAHAGEEGPPEYIQEALTLLHIERLDHGNRAIESPSLMTQLKASQIPLTLCPLSNLKLCVIANMHEHPIQKMLDAGLLITINSDDPAYFGGYLNENYFAIQSAFSLSQTVIIRLIKNSFIGSFLSDTEKHTHIQAIDECLL